MAAAVAPSLTLLYQASIDQGLVPDDWRQANVAPIFKKGGPFQTVQLPASFPHFSLLENGRTHHS